MLYPDGAQVQNGSWKSLWEKFRTEMEVLHLWVYYLLWHSFLSWHHIPYVTVSMLLKNIRHGKVLHGCLLVWIFLDECAICTTLWSYINTRMYLVRFSKLCNVSYWHCLEQTFHLIKVSLLLSISLMFNFDLLQTMGNNWGNVVELHWALGSGNFQWEWDGSDVLICLWTKW